MISFLPPSAVTSQGLCTRNAAWKYVSGLDRFRSMKIPVQGFTVTPVVSLPQERVMVLLSSGSPMDFCTGSSAAAPMPAPVPAQTLTV